jgi:hypothetical protein
MKLLIIIQNWDVLAPRNAEEEEEEEGCSLLERKLFYCIRMLKKYLTTADL